ncbi:aspartate/glutamate racemase family protein [Microbacterium sp. 179-I 3D4 NHS]|uniref:aspartate/glutamate racemase family protein n=1 Tax=Microbacterium sp. 179-I 3D4 NHS TaxID=3142381 RepID=UPI0039A3F142
MKTIGMLGGMSWESTALYYRLANERVRERRGGFHSAPLLLDSVDFAEIEELQRRDDWAAAGELLAERARRLESIGAELLLICTNTMHLVIDRIEDAVGIPVLHIADAVGEAITADGLTRVGLLGTAFTMEQPFYRDRIGAHGIDVLVPDEAERAAVHRIIYDELVQGIVTDASRKVLSGIVGGLVDRGAQGIVLGCTEIELLVTAADSPVPVFPSAALHIHAAVEAALAADA